MTDIDEHKVLNNNNNNNDDKFDKCKDPNIKFIIEDLGEDIEDILSEINSNTN